MKKRITAEWFFEQMVAVADPKGSIGFNPTELCEVMGISAATFFRRARELRDKGVLEDLGRGRGFTVALPENVREVKLEGDKDSPAASIQWERPELPDGALTREEIQRIFFPEDAPIIAQVNRLRLKQFEEEQRMRVLEEELRDMERQRDKAEKDYKRLLNKELKKALVENSGD